MNLFNTILISTKQQIPPELQYVSIPAAPSFSSPATITDAIGSSLESGEITGNAADILVAGNAIPGLFNNRLRPNGISNRRFKSAGSSRVYIGGDNVGESTQVIAPLNNSDNLKYYHLGIKGNSNPLVTGISGLNHLASAGGTTIEAVDIVIKDTSFACIQINQGTDGLKYASIILTCIRGFGFAVDPDGELVYIGNTNKAANRSKIDLLIITDLYGYNKFRDGLQITWAKDMRINRGTIVNCGIGGMALQDKLFQIHNSNGYIRNYIFHAEPGKTAKPGEIFAHGVSFVNGYMEWAVNEPIYIGDLESSSFGPNGTNEYATREPIIFDGYVFAPSVPVTFLFDIRERNANIILRNCIFNSHVATVISDNRGASPGNTITVEASCITVSAASIPTVSYKNHDPDQEDTHGLVTSIYHYNRGVGFRTPS